MRVKIDTDKCEGHQLCVKLLPEIFLLDAEEYTYTEADKDVPKEYEEMVRQAAQACPEQAIIVSE